MMNGPVYNAVPAGYESDDSIDDLEPLNTGQDADAVGPDGDATSLFKAAINRGDTEMVENLLDKGSDVEMKLTFGWTPLMYAVNVANYDMAKVLLDKGACANFSKDHWTVLMASCSASASEDKIARCVELLLSRNADPNMAHSSQMTCLMLAARDGYSRVINLLVSHGAEINSQNDEGYTALSMAVQFGRVEAVLKLLQLGADKTVRTKADKSPAELAAMLKYKQISKILSASSYLSTDRPFTSLEETLSKIFKTDCNSPESQERLGDMELLLHGLDLGHLTDIMRENDITWGQLLTMEKEDLEKIGVSDPADQQKVLCAVQEMLQDTMDEDAVTKLVASESGNEELLNFLITVTQQCCNLTESIQDVISRFPPHPSQLVFPVDPKKEAQVLCSQLILQIDNLHKQANCIHKLLHQMEDATGSCRFPPPRANRRMRPLSRVVLRTLAVAAALILCKAGSGKVLQMCRNIC